MDKVSVVIPTYNRMGIICDAIDSVLSQTYPNMEVIVVDDGSTDKTLDVLGKYENKIKVISQDNKGCSAARNQGIKSCTGEYIAFLDSDDKWFPTKTEKQIALLSQAGKEASCCWCNLLVEMRGCVRDRLSMDHLRPKYRQGLWLNPLEILATRFVLFNQAIMVRRDALERAGYFDESLWVMEDYDLAIRLSLLGPWVYTNEPLVICREGANNRISREASENPSKLSEACIKIYDKYINDPFVCRGKALRYMKINRYFWILDKNFNEQPRRKGLSSFVQRVLIFYYSKIIKAAYRRFTLLINMETKPLSVTR